MFRTRSPTIEGSSYLGALESDNCKIYCEKSGLAPRKHYPTITADPLRVADCCSSALWGLVALRARRRFCLGTGQDRRVAHVRFLSEGGRRIEPVLGSSEQEMQRATAANRLGLVLALLFCAHLTDGWNCHCDVQLA